MIHALACPAAAPRPTAAVELREPHCALRPATETGSGRARLTPSLGPPGLPPRAGSLAWLRRFFGGDSKAACRRLASQLAAHSATMGRSAISHGELAALLVDGEASMPSAWLYAPFEQQQSARSSTKPPSPLFADKAAVCTAPPPPAIQSGEAPPGMNTSRSRKRSRHEHEAHQQKLKKDVKRLHEMLAKQAKRREDAPSFAAAAQKGSWRSKPFPPCPPPGKNRTFYEAWRNKRQRQEQRQRQQQQQQQQQQ